MKIEFQLRCTDGISPPGPTRSVLVLTFCLRTQSGYIKLHDFPDKRVWTSQKFTLLRRIKVCTVSKQAFFQAGALRQD